jgi:regulator of protease activity HflC (stomatin/prohibitin superfamily)
MKQNRSFAALIFIVIVGMGAALAYGRYRVGANAEAVGMGVGAFLLALVVASAIQVADQWDKAVILRLGHFHVVKGPGLFFIIPVIDAIPYWIDTRVITTAFKAEKTLTKRMRPLSSFPAQLWKACNLGGLPG